MAVGIIVFVGALIIGLVITLLDSGDTENFSGPNISSSRNGSNHQFNSLINDDNYQRRIENSKKKHHRLQNNDKVSNESKTSSLKKEEAQEKDGFEAYDDFFEQDDDFNSKK